MVVLLSEQINMFGDGSRLSHLVKRITKETERDRRLTAAQQFEEFLNDPENSQVPQDIHIMIKIARALLVLTEHLHLKTKISKFKWFPKLDKKRFPFFSMWDCIVLCLLLITVDFSPEGTFYFQVVDKHAENLFVVVEDILFER